MKQIARLTFLLLLTTILVAIGALLQSKFADKNNSSIFWTLWGTSIIFGYSIWIFLESYYDLRLSPGIEGERGEKGERGIMGIRGRCHYPKYVGPLKTDEGIKSIEKNNNTTVNVGHLKQSFYGTREWLSGTNAGRITGDKINGKAINFRKCQKLCNSTNDCKSFLYNARKDTDKKTGDTYEDKGCLFYNTSCVNAGEKCTTQKIKLYNYIDKDIIGLHEKQ